jgi:hypothetical protein
MFSIELTSDADGTGPTLGEPHPAMVLDTAVVLRQADALIAKDRQSARGWRIINGAGRVVLNSGGHVKNTDLSLVEPIELTAA